MGVPAMIISTSLTSPGLVKFDFNPEQIKVVRVVNTASRGSASPNAGTPSGASGSIFKRAPASKLTLNKLIFYGMDTKPRCDTLMNWMSPSGGLLGSLIGAVAALAGINLRTSPPTVTFSWGPPMMGFMYDCKINSATCTYTRFDPSGIPIRASVDLELQEQPSLLSLLSTNPTSGGEPGRRAHQYSDGDSLQGIATRNYGAPGYWRGIADTNGVDDPMRVRAGDTLYLPNAGEMRRDTAR
jgi:hypothetical protein